MNVFLIIPGLPLLVVLAAFLGSGNTGYYRFRADGHRLGLAGADHALADAVAAGEGLRRGGQVSGESNARIIFGEILPNMTSIVVASFSAPPSSRSAPQPGWSSSARQSQRRQLGHQPLLGGEQRRPADRRLVDLRPGRGLHRAGRLRLSLMNYAMDEVTNPACVPRETAMALKTARSVQRHGGRATPCSASGSHVQARN